MQIEDASPRPLPHRSAHALAQVTSEKVESLASAREVGHSRLLRMQLEAETLEHRAHPLTGCLDVALRVTEHHEVLDLAGHRAESRTPVLPRPLEDRQVDVGDHG